MHSDDEPEDGCDKSDVDTAPIDPPQTLDAGEGARLAAQYVPEAIRRVVATMRNPGRNAQTQLRAAQILLELAGCAPVQAAGKAPTSIATDEERQRLRAEMARRLAGGNR